MPIFPAPTCRPALPFPSGPAGGFTFVEALIAILIASLLTGVVSAVMTQVIAMEERAVELRRARRQLERVACRLDLFPGPEPNMEEVLASEWQLTAESADPDEAGPWTRWRLTPRSDPSATYGLWFRSDLSPWRRGLR